MMGDLVRNHIGSREITGRAQTLRHDLKELRVEIGLVVARAVERPGCRAGGSTSRTGLAGKQHKLWGLILLSHLLKDRSPNVLGIRKDNTDKLLGLIVNLIRTRLHLSPARQ